MRSPSRAARMEWEECATFVEGKKERSGERIEEVSRSARRLGYLSVSMRSGLEICEGENRRDGAEGSDRVSLRGIRRRREGKTHSLAVVPLCGVKHSILLRRDCR